MMHWPILPILVPLSAAILILALHGAGLTTLRAVSLVATATLAALSLAVLLLAGDGAVRVYRLGDWPAPYGIVLVLDRLSAIMVALTAALALPALLLAFSGADAAGRHFHAFFQFQLAGLNGAFLTGDVFNLFVFFEILLLASYALLAQGGGAQRARAGLVYASLNLVGSALFLIALGLIYGTLGTLNLADLALVLPQVAPEGQAPVRTAVALLVAVFLLKAAVVPLSLWLPGVYTAALAPVAVLFAIMTKVGVYALLRVHAVGLAPAGFVANILQPWLPWLALLTIALGAVGAAAARSVSALAANLVVASTGTLLAAVSAGTPTAAEAALFYLPHTTLVTGGLFLLAGCIASERGSLADAIERGPRVRRAVPIGVAFLVLAVAASGMPPLSGFLGKTMLLQALGSTPTGPAAWTVLLTSGLVAMLAFARAGSAIFWEAQDGAPDAPAAARAAPRTAGWALAFLAAASPVLSLGAAPASDYARAAAAQLHAPQAYVAAVLGARPDIVRERRP